MNINIKPTCNICNIYFNPTNLPLSRKYHSKSPEKFVLDNATKIYKNSKKFKNKSATRNSYINYAKRPNSAFCDNPFFKSSTWSNQQVQSDYGKTFDNTQRNMHKHCVKIKIRQPVHASFNSSIKNSYRELGSREKKNPEIVTDKISKRIIKNNTNLAKIKQILNPNLDNNQEMGKTYVKNLRKNLQSESYKTAVSPLRVNSSLSITNLSININILSKNEYEKSKFPTRSPHNPARIFNKHLQLKKNSLLKRKQNFLLMEKPYWKSIKPCPISRQHSSATRRLRNYSEIRNKTSCFDYSDLRPEPPRYMLSESNIPKGFSFTNSFQNAKNDIKEGQSLIRNKVIVLQNINFLYKS